MRAYDRAFRSAAALAFFAILSLALNHAYLRGGFQADDFFFINILRQDPAPFSRWTGLWFPPIETYPAFTSLWWFEEGATGSFLRPLPSLVLEGSLRLFGERAWPLHLLSILLHAGVAFSVFLFFARLTGGRRGLAFLAALLFATCEDHSMGIGWIATITDLLCVQLLMLALLAHLRWRATRRPIHLVLFMVPLAGAFASKETAALAPLLVVLLEMCVPDAAETAQVAAAPAPPPLAGRGVLARSLARLRRRWKAWLPAVAAMIAYLVLYRAAGGGGMKNLMYTNPLLQPLLYLQHAALNLPVMVLAAVTPVPPSLAVFIPRTMPALATAGTLALAVLCAALWPLRRDRIVAWSFASLFVVLLPQLGADPEARLLYLPFVPASFLFASILAMLPARVRAPRFTRIYAYALVFGMAVPGFLLSALGPPGMSRMLRKPERELLTGLDAIRDRAPADVVLLNTSGPFVTFYAGSVYEYHLRRPVRARILSSAWAEVTLERIDDHAFILRADRPGWLTNMFARIVRIEERLAPGRVYAGPLFDATLLELTTDGRDALAVRFDFPRGLADPAVLFLAWDGERFAPLDWASAPAGRRIPLADTSDVLKALMM